MSVTHTAPRNVRAEVRALEIGGQTKFSMDRYDYVVSCAYRLGKTERKTFSSNMQGDEVVVTRLK